MLFRSDHLRIPRELGLRSAMAAPLTARGRTFGALTIISAESRRRYTADALSLASELARPPATAIAQAPQFDAAVAPPHTAPAPTAPTSPPQT